MPTRARLATWFLMVCTILGLTAVGCLAERDLAPVSPVITVGREGCDFASIQEAIDQSTGAHVIRLIDAIHTEGGITVSKDVLIVGNGPEGTIVQAHGDIEASTERVFLVEEGAFLTLNGLTLRHGHPSECPKGGGAIANYGTLWLIRCVLRDNRGQCGGALMNEGRFYAFDSMFLDNAATGGIDQTGARARGSGGAIKNVEGAGFLSGCTIAGNTANIHGGGLKGCCSGTLQLVNCTVSGNKATSQGGGIHTRGELTLLYCTITDNLANEKLAPVRGALRAAGIYLDGPTSLVASIVAQNDGQDVHIGGDGDLLRNDSCLVGDAGIHAELSGDSGLTDLGDHGGPTRTHALLLGSQAIDAFTGEGIWVDQRGLPRPQGGSCDVGSVERGAQGEEDATAAGGELP